jgi:crotonobetainyl-CoA:carnitine CoA-transferase CaiB-like acyl-CoA transferase
VAAVLDGVKVVEVAGWTFVPAGGGVLADSGADVIKIEHPETGDPQRGLSIGTVVRGEGANRAGCDGSSYFCRGGVAHMLMEQNMEWPPMQRPAFGDILGGFALASGIAAALFKRERTGEPSVVDVSLLGMAAWHLSPDLVAAGLLGEANLPRFTDDDMPNPIVNYYKTLEEWRARMPALEGAWAVVQTPGEVLTDPQVRENGYVRRVTGEDGETSYDLVANPVQFDETPPELTRAPDSGEHTDEILEKELGLDWDAIVALKLNNTVS